MSAKRIVLFSSIAVSLFSQMAFAKLTNGQVAARVSHLTSAFEQVMQVPETSIPLDLLKHAKCVATIQVVKAGFGLGGEGGLGLASCRDGTGQWRAPVFMDLGGLNIGFQLGVEKIDLTLVFTNPDAPATFSHGSFKLSGNVGLTVGPLGRDLSVGTSFPLKNAVYSYSTAKGFFGGVALDGSALNPDKVYNDFVYQNKSPADIQKIGVIGVPALVAPFVHALGSY
jgi:lipid-binding SYLF domain-containing protein